jgi:serine protease AprX
VVCVAAGNDGPAKNTIGSPAAAAKPITVGAMGDPFTTGYFLCSFSSRGPTADNRVKPDICAPGFEIKAAKAGTRDQYTMMSGTSMAAPFVAGTAALMLDVKPNLTPADIKSDLMSTAQDWGPSGADIDYGSGRELGYEAVKLSFWQAGHDTTGYTGPNDPPHVYRSEALSGTGKTDIWQVNVDTTGCKPLIGIDVTMIMPNWRSSSDPNFDLYLYDPTGMLVDSAKCQCREDYFYHNYLYIRYVPGNYQIWVTSKAGSGDYFFDLSCPNATSIIRIQNEFGPQGTPTVVSLSRIELFPNPSKAGRVTVSYSLPRAGQMTVTLFDVSGRAVRTQKVAASGVNGSVSIDVRGLSSGVYVARLKAEDFSVSKSLVVGR